MLYHFKEAECCLYVMMLGCLWRYYHKISSRSYIVIKFPLDHISAVSLKTHKRLSKMNEIVLNPYLEKTQIELYSNYIILN